jgi:hypothetical protein
MSLFQSLSGGHTLVRDLVCRNMEPYTLRCKSTRLMLFTQVCLQLGYTQIATEEGYNDDE